MQREPLLERRDEGRQVALALGEREAAGRQRDAGHGVAAQRAGMARQPVLVDERLDRRAILGRDIRDDDILVRGEAELALVHLGDAAHPVRSAGPSGMSRRRPFSMKSVRWKRPSSPSVQP